MKGRFLCEVNVEGRKGIAHIPDPSPLAELFQKGRAVLLEEGRGSNRLSDFTIYAVETDFGLTGVNSFLPNKLVERALLDNLIFEEGVMGVHPEYPLDKKRFDFLVETERGNVVVEVKSASLIRGESAFFPHSPTERGRRHIAAMARMIGKMRALLIFVAQNGNVKEVRVNEMVDPLFSAELKMAVRNGLEVMGLKIVWDLPYICIGEKIPVLI